MIVCKIKTSMLKSTISTNIKITVPKTAIEFWRKLYTIAGDLGEKIISNFFNLSPVGFSLGCSTFFCMLTRQPAMHADKNVNFFFLSGTVARKTFESRHADSKIEISVDHDENKYQRRGAVDWFTKWFG